MLHISPQLCLWILTTGHQWIQSSYKTTNKCKTAILRGGQQTFRREFNYPMPVQPCVQSVQSDTRATPRTWSLPITITGMHRIPIMWDIRPTWYSVSLKAGQLIYRVGYSDLQEIKILAFIIHDNLEKILSIIFLSFTINSNIHVSVIKWQKLKNLIFSVSGYSPLDTGQYQQAEITTRKLTQLESIVQYKVVIQKHFHNR